MIWAGQALLPEGWAEGVAIAIDAAGRIAEVSRPPAPPPGAEARAVVLPAPANLHSHAFQRAMAGLTERRGPDPRDSFWTWRQLMFRFLDRLSPDDIAAITAFAQMGMLRAGFAAVAEFHYLHHAPGGVPYADPAETSARIVAAAVETGIGLTLLPVLYEQGGCDGRPLGPGQVRFGSTPDAFARLAEGAERALAPLPADRGFGIAPHSLRAVSVAGLAAAVALRPDRPIHMHLSEQPAEVAEVLAARGARPGAWLLEAHDVGPRWCLIHATHLDASEIAGLARSGGAAGGAIGIGTDSNIRLSLAEELRTLEYSQRLRDGARAVLAEPDRSTGRVLYDTALAGGAQALGRATGAIAPGLWADLLALDAEAPDLAGRRGDAILDAFVFAGDNAMVRDVWAAGRHVIADGHHAAEARITAAYRAVMARLLGA
jgi:formimidoylglutamate deiminase